MDNKHDSNSPKKPAEIGLAGLVEQHLSRYINADRAVLPSSGLYDRVMGEVERPLLRLVMDVTKGNQLAAARLLGMNRNTLHKKLKNHKLLAKKGGR